MTNIQSQKEGKGPIEKVSFVAHRDPIFQTPIVDTTSAAGGNIAVDSGKVNFGPRGPGRLGIVVGQLNTTDPDVAGPLTGTDIAAWTATIKVYDIDGLQIGNDITQTIPLTPSGKSVLTALSIDQQVALRAQYMTLTGTIVAPALTTMLKVYITEQSPEQEVSVSGDGIATEATLSALNTKMPAQGQALAAASIPVVLTAIQLASLKIVGGGTTLVNASGASGANLLDAGAAGKKHRIFRLFLRAGAATSVTLSDGAGVFGTDASGNCVLDLNPIGAIQGTAATAITVTTGDSSAWTATVIYSDE